MITHALARDPQVTVLNAIRPAIVATYPAAHVGARVPDPNVGPVITVRIDGAPQVDQVQTEARLGMNVWADTEAEAFALAAVAAKALLESADGTVILGSTSVSGPVWVAEPANARAHIYQTFEAVIAGSAT